MPIVVPVTPLVSAVSPTLIVLIEIFAGMGKDFDFRAFVKIE